MRVVDEAFDKAASPGTVYRIPRLEIDLGTIPYETYREEMPKRLHEQLDALLADIGHSYRCGDTSNNIVIDKTNAEVGQLYHFLLYGHLPWYSRLADISELASLLEQTIDSGPAAFRAFLSHASHRQTVVGRLVSQFPIRSIIRVYTMLAPVHSRAMQDWMIELETLVMTDFALVLPYGLEPDRLISMLWQCLIMEALRDNRSQANAQDLFEQALKEVAVNRLQLDFSALMLALDRSLQSHRDLKLMVVLLRNYKPDAPAGKSGLVVSKDLSSSGHDDESPFSDRKNYKPDLNTLSEQLASALQYGDASVIRPCWSALLTEHARLLEQVLRYHGQQSKVRRRIAFNFPADMLLDILMLLEPADYDFVKGTIESGLFYADPSRESSVQMQRRAEMWEISFGYLLVERTGGFSRQAYLGSVIRQRARVAGRAPAALLSVIYDNIAAIAESDKQASPLVQYLMDHAGYNWIEDIEQQEKHEPGMVARYRDYQRIKTGLTDRSASSRSGDADLLDAVATLRQQAPWLLIKLYRELQAGAYADSTIFQHCSVEMVRELVTTFLSLTAGPGSDIYYAVQRYANASSNRQHYYLYILERLLKAELIDFDSIKTGSDAEQDKREHPGLAGSLAEHPEQLSAANESVSKDHADHAVVDWLCGDKDLTGSEIGNIASWLEKMATRNASELRQLLESGLANESFIQRLAGSTPDWLQMKLLALIGVSGSAEMLQCADLLATACLTKDIINRPEQLHTLKWACIYSYIEESGRLFNRDYFVSRFVDSMLPHTGFADARQLALVLRDELQHSMPPSSGDVLQGLTESLRHPVSSLPRTEPARALAETSGTQKQGDDLSAEEEIHIANAGLILTAPYLPRLFELLGLVKDSAFKDRRAAERGVHMLQFLVNEAVSSPEYLLVLNKLLCGVKPGRPICRKIMLSADEKQLLESMLLGLMQNWKPLANTSIDGFRESFLRRNGRLQLKNDAWHLSVEARSYDMLLDQLPWSCSTIRFPWMHRVIYVEWR